MTSYPLNDGDPGWRSFEGAMRVRTVAGVVQIQTSTDNGDGTFTVATIVLAGDLRDVRPASLTKWPSYTSTGLPTNFLTDAQRLAREQQKAAPRGLNAGDGPPISASSPKH